jgi:heme oxygenase
LLARFLGFYEPLEEQLQALDGWSEAGIDFAARRKAPWLAHDLAALGMSPGEITAIARCDRLPPVDTLARGFGCAYVLEGATLGGRHITQMLSGTDIPDGARTFFRSYGAAVGERWKEFTSALEAFGEKGDETEIVEAARETFASLQTWLGGAR